MLYTDAGCQRLNTWLVNVDNSVCHLVLFAMNQIWLDCNLATVWQYIIFIYLPMAVGPFLLATIKDRLYLTTNSPSLLTHSWIKVHIICDGSISSGNNPLLKKSSYIPTWQEHPILKNEAMMPLGTLSLSLRACWCYIVTAKRSMATLLV